MLTWLDWVIILFYFAVIAGISWWAVKKKDKTSADDYFLAGRHLGWFVVGASIFASNIGSEHLVGLAGSGATDGVALAHYELHAWCLLVLGWGLSLCVPKCLLCRSFLREGLLRKQGQCCHLFHCLHISLLKLLLAFLQAVLYSGHSYRM